MNYSSDAAEQVVRISLNGIEYVARLSGEAAKRIAALIYAVMKDQKKTRGKTRLTAMMKSEKPLKVFGVRDDELQRFCEEAKKYGVLYCVLKDRKANDGITDLFVRAEDASKINRIYERYNFTKIVMANVKTDIALGRKSEIPGMTEKEEKTPESINDAINGFLKNVVHQSEKQETENANPSLARTMESSRSVPTSGPGLKRETADTSRSQNKPSVKKELESIKAERSMASKAKTISKSRKGRER